MAKVLFQDEQGQNLNWFRLVAVEGQTNVYALERVATITQQGTPYNKEVGDHFLQVEDGTPVQTLSCAKIGTAYALTGLTATAGKVVVVFQADAAYVAGNTFAVDGVSYSLVTSNGAALASGAFAAGVVLAVVLDIDNQKIHIKGDLTLGQMGAAAASHNQAASTITAGTLAGAVVANAAAVATVGTKQVRNLTISTADPTGGASGDVWHVYTA